MYRAVTRGIEVTAEPQWRGIEPREDGDRYFWSYTIRIENLSGLTVQLLSRVWRITDETGHVEIVRGPGVVGQQPLLKHGEVFEYTSGCPLSTPSGLMVGSYQFQDMAGDLFDVAVPAFSLDSPGMSRSVN